VFYFLAFGISQDNNIGFGILTGRMADGWPQRIGVTKTDLGLYGYIVSHFMHKKTSGLDLEL